jgi:outer membrane receptor protein involved in Fe transport
MNHTRTPQRPRPSLLAVALASCLVLAAPVAFAQSTSATLRGTVTAGAGPAGDGQVTATNLATGFTSRVAIGSDGRYNVAGLPPGTYRIDVNAGGQTSSRTVTLAVGQVATLDLPVAGATQLDAVVVQGVALQETRTSEISTYISSKQIEALPQGSRNFLAFADTVPGVVFSTDPNDDSTKLRGGSQSSNGVNVFIDGVGQKNYVVKGGITGQDSSSGNPFPQLAIGQYKVITSNYKAEFDQLSSVAVVAATKSGTNEFHGDLFYSYTDDGLRNGSLREAQAGKKTPGETKEYGFAVGGPILKDRMHYFFSYERKDIDRPRELRLGEGYTIDDLPANLQAQANETSNAPFKEDLYFGKIDWTPDENQIWELSVKHRTEDELTNVGNGPNAASYGTNKTGDDTRWDLHWQWNADTWMNDAHLTYEDASFGPRPATIGPGAVYTSDYNGRVVMNTGGGRDYQDKGQKGWAIQDDMTFYELFGGGHTVKMGVKYKQVEINAFEQQPYNAQFFYNLAGDPTTPYQVQFGSAVGGVDRDITSRNKQFGIYVQDDWEVNDKLTLNLGVRWDYEDTPGYRDYVTPAGLAAALRGWSNLQGPNVDYDIEDYISDGDNREAFKGAFAPRLGFSYDLFADQRHVVFGGVGRSYDRNLWDYLALEQSKTTFPSYTYQFNVPGNPCTPGVGNCLAWNPSYFDQSNLDALVAANQNLGAELNLMNNDLDTPYSDQVSLGMRNVFELWGNDWSSSVTLSHVRSHDGIVFSLGNRWPDGSYRNPANPSATWGGQPWDFPVPGYGRLIKADNGIETRNNSLLVSLEKGYTEASRWGMTVAYTFNDGEENRNSAYNSDEHYLFDYPTPQDEGFHRTLGLARHRLVVTGIVGTQHGLTVSSKLVLASPTPKEALNCNDAASFNNCFWDPFTPSDWLGEKRWDIAAEKSWSLGGDMKLRLRADLLNVMNWREFTDYSNWRGGPGEAHPPSYGTRNGPGQAGIPRTLKLTAGFSW